MICPNCNFENNDTAKFCNECGSPLQAASLDREAESSLYDDQATEEAGAGAEDGFDGDSAGSEDFPETAPIDLPVINLAEDDEFDFSLLDADEAPAPGRGERKAQAASDGAGATVVLPGRVPGETAILPDRSTQETISFPPHSISDDDRFGGIDEILADGSYQAPALKWAKGSTMEMPRIEGAAPSQQKEFKAPDGKKQKKGREKKKRNKTPLVIVISVLVVAALAGGITYYLELWGGHAIPNVVGQSKTQATQTLEAKGFVVKSLKVKSDDTEDLVLLMDPGAGRRLAEKSEIVLHVATPRVVPDVVGKTQEEAKKAIAQEGFEKVEYAQVKSNQPEGLVLSIEPGAGTKAKASTPVTIKVAVPYTVPDVVGKDQVQAVELLNQEGYQVVITTAYSEAAENSVITSDPAPGTKLASGSIVTIQVAKSRAKELVALTSSYFNNAGTISVGGTTYEVASVDGVSYMGNNTTQATVTVVAVTILDGEIVRGSPKQKVFTLTWTDSNQLASIT